MMHCNRLFTIIICCVFALVAQAQQLQVKEMTIASNDPAATQYKEIDHNGKLCALVIVGLAADSILFEGNVIKQERRPNGEYWVYVTEGTMDFQISSRDYLPEEVKFSRFGIRSLEGGKTYRMSVEKPVLVIKQTEAAPRSSFTVGAGFNVMSIMGPSVSLGFMYKNFCLEAGAVYGLNKSADVYIYNQSGVLQDAFNYSAIRGFLRAGYDIWAVPVLAISPQVGAAFNAIRGSRISDADLPSDKVLDGASAISATAGVRLMFAPSGRSKAFRIYLTPEYDFALSKDKNFEALADFDSKIKQWADGLNVSLGLMFYF